MLVYGEKFMRVVHFEISTNDPESIIKFHEEVFGWKFKKMIEKPVEHWQINTGDEEKLGIHGGLTKMPKAGATLRVTIEVPSLDESVKKIKENGGTVIIPRMPVPRVGYAALFKDPEGITFGIIERDPSVF